MSNFNYQEYLKNNPLLQEEVKDQLITESLKENEYQEEEELELDADYDKGGKYYSEEGAEAFRIQPFKLNDIEYTKDQAMKQGKYIVGLEGEELKKFISDYIAAWEADKGDTESGKTFKEDLEEDARTRAEEEGFLDGKAVEKADMKKMKVSELKAKIKETILAELSLSEADEDEMDVDIDVEDEVSVDVEEPAEAAGLSSDEQEIQDNLKMAYDNAVAIGDQKLADQIGNSITFFTRTHVVER